MLDRYLYGDVTRISQEAPVPIVHYRREEQRPGAAANVAANCRALGAEVSLVSLVGDDGHGETLGRMLKDQLVVSQFSTAAGPTVQKLRVIGKQQQVVRVDFEERPAASAVNAMHILAMGLIPQAAMVVFSDYGKGSLATIAALITAAKREGKLVLVDPKGHNYTRYAGADMVKPNLHEMRELVGGWDSEIELESCASALMDKARIGSILLTRAAEGMTLFRPGREPYHVHSLAQEVFDVSGAGDTAIAAYAVALSRGMTQEEAVLVANKAAGIVVGKFGTAVATSQEVFG
jgi:rfaE bifunctional protein kinase chain/domain